MLRKRLYETEPWSLLSQNELFLESSDNQTTYQIHMSYDGNLADIAYMDGSLKPFADGGDMEEYKDSCFKFLTGYRIDSIAD